MKLLLLILLPFFIVSCKQTEDKETSDTGLTDPKMILNQKFNNWLESISKEEKIDAAIIAFNFGIIESAKGYKIYLIGSKKYDEGDDDWATEEDYVPKEKYFLLKDTSGKKWEDVLKISVELVSQYVNSEGFKTSEFKKAQAITTGFDDGDLVRIK